MPVTRTLVRTTYLEISADTPLRPPSRPRPDYELRHAVAITPDYARFLYRGVGYPWELDTASELELRQVGARP